MADCPASRPSERSGSSLRTQTFSVGGVVHSSVRRSREEFTLRPATLLTLLVGLWLSASPASGAAHSDIIVSHSNGTLQVDATLHTGDVRENDASGNGTIWATDNPGFAGSRFRFNDELLFDVTGPLRRWADGRWSTNNLGPEFMQFVEPGPFGDPLNSVTITRSISFVPGYQIAQAGTRGSIHTHFIFVLRATNGVAPAVGAYSFPLTLRSPRYDSAPPVHLVFNNGLEETSFNAAVDQLRAAREMRLSLNRGTNGLLSLTLFTTEGETNQLLSAPAPSGPWNDEGGPFVGHGGLHQQALNASNSAQFFRAQRIEP